MRLFIIFSLLTGCTSAAPVSGIGTQENLTATLCIAPEANYNLATIAADNWAQASDKVHLTIIESQEGDPSCHTWIANQDLSEGLCGETFDNGELILIDPTHCLLGGDVSLLSTYTHELGHFLSGLSHSTNSEDLMYKTNLDVTIPTSRDIARLP